MIALQRRGTFLNLMAEFYYCMGHWLDENFMEHVCKQKENCKYYQEDFFVKYKDMLDRCDFLICKEKCEYHLPMHEEVKRELKEDKDIFAI